MWRWVSCWQVAWDGRARGPAPRWPCPIYSPGSVTVPDTRRMGTRTWTRAHGAAVLEFGDDIPWGGTFPFLTRAVFCDFGGFLFGGERKRSCFAVLLRTKTQRCRALPAKPKHVELWNQLCSGVRALCGTGDLITRGVYSLSRLWFLLLWVFSVLGFFGFFFS